MIPTRTRVNDLFDEFTVALGDIKIQPSYDNLKDLKNCLQKLFPESAPNDVIYTQNIDKLGFYVFIMPKLTGDEVVDIIFKNKKFIPYQYDLELDSKLFDPALGLTTNEIATLVFHDLFMMLSNASPAIQVRNWINNYLIEKNTILKIPELVHYRRILAYGFAESMRKVTSIFDKNNLSNTKDIQMMDEFFGKDVMFSDRLISAFNKLLKAGTIYNREITDKYITMKWVLRIYNNIASNRVPGILGIQKCIDLTASKLEQKMLTQFKQTIMRIDDEDILTEAETGYDTVVDDEILERIRDTFISSNYSVEDSINAEDDFSIISAKSDGIDENNPDGLGDLLNEINAKMAGIQDYVDRAPDLPKSEIARWKTMFKEYDILRRKLVVYGTLYPSDTNRYLRDSYMKNNEQ